jgi:reactive intermediate/imine deaminase
MIETVKQNIHSNNAPSAVGTYSQAIKTGNTVFLSGQIPLDPQTMTLVDESMEKQVIQILNNLSSVAHAAGGSLNHIVRLGIYLTNMNDFPVINEVMKRYFKEPFPARSTIGVNALPKGAFVEMDAIMVLPE